MFLPTQCREIGYETHEEILRVLHELHTTMKTYHSYQGEYRQAENKLRIAENQRLKLEQSLPREKLDRSKKYRLIEKEVQKVSTTIFMLIFCVVWLWLRVFWKFADDDIWTFWGKVTVWLKKLRFGVLVATHTTALYSVISSLWESVVAWIYHGSRLSTAEIDTFTLPPHPPPSLPPTVSLFSSPVLTFSLHLSFTVSPQEKFTIPKMKAHCFYNERKHLVGFNIGSRMHLHSFS